MFYFVSQTHCMWTQFLHALGLGDVRMLFWLIYWEYIYYVWYC